VSGAIPPTASMLNTVYEQHKDKDGFLYIEYSDENVFG
jgi:GABA(A) receptor-associated protein